MDGESKRKSDNKERKGRRVLNEEGRYKQLHTHTFTLRHVVIPSVRICVYPN